MTRTNASPDRDLFLAALVDDAADGQRVLWVGDASSRGPIALADRAERVVVLDTRPEAEHDADDEDLEDTRGELVIRHFSEGPPSDPYDVAVIAELAVFHSLRPALERLERLVGDGLLVLVTDTRNGLEPEFVQDCVRDVFGAGRWFGQSAFVGDTVAELGAADVAGAAVDAGLLSDTPPLQRFIAVVGAERDRLPGYLVVQTAESVAALSAPTARLADVSDRVEDRDADRDRDDADLDDVEELEELREQLEASEDYAEEVERALATRDASLARAQDELDDLREQLARLTAVPMGEAAREDEPDAYDQLEERLREVGRRAAALEQEVERRGTLVRDAVEEAARLRRELARDRVEGPLAAGVPSASVAVPVPVPVPAAPLPVVTRASDAPTPLQHAKLAAELDAARFENDALRIALEGAASERAAALELVEAELLGRVRGLRARIAELTELHETSHARLALAESDTMDALERERRLQAELGRLRETFEVELIRARGAEHDPTALPDEVREHIATLERSEGQLSQRVSALSLQLAAARDLASGAPFEGQLRALAGEITGLRFRLSEREQALATLRSERASAPVVAVSAPVAAVTAQPADGTTAAESELVHRLRSADDTIDAMRTQLGLKDGLITRLQLELSDNESVSRTSESDAHRLRDENERLREALLSASAAVDERDALQREVETLSKSVVEPGRIYALERARDEAKAAAEAALQELLAARAEVRKHAAASDASEALKAERDVLLGRVAQAIQARDEARVALRETHAILSGVSLPGVAPRTTTAVGIEAPGDDDDLGASIPTGASSEAQDAVAAYLERLQTLESELAGQETLMRSLTAQLEERDDRIRALDRRLGGASPAASDEESTKRAMLELEERAARLSEELQNERASRLAAQRRVEQVERTQEAAPDLTELNARLRAREAELDAAESRAKSAARDVESLRAVVRDASSSLEGLLSSATASGDPATAQRLGELLTQLARF